VDQGFFPELINTPLVGSWDEPEYEKIAELDPDFVIMLSSYPLLPDEVQEHFAPFGIAIISLDFYRMEVYFKEVWTLGFILGLDEEAKNYINFFKEKAIKPFSGKSREFTLNDI